MDDTTTGSLALTWENAARDTAQAAIKGLAMKELAEKRIFEFLLKWALNDRGSYSHYKSHQRLS
ncbi:hypothetical protein HALOI3_70353 [Halomonas sp. I3]|nr:hypothetical protein HALOI3_70353 [Halomonas sp. I3]VXB59878.1 hypothetical protein HALO153_180022 [Halomonas titanicae]